MKPIHIYIFCLLTILIYSDERKLSAQNFNYSINRDSVAWNELNAQTILNASNTPWEVSYRIPIGFSFNYLGQNFDSVTIETNGYIVFDGVRNYAFTAFSELGDVEDSVGIHSVISYENTGTPGNRTLKVQFLNCGISGDFKERQSWQIWIKEDGSIAILIGPGTLREQTNTVSLTHPVTLNDSIVTVVEIDSVHNTRIGLINMNMDTPLRGYFIGNDPSAPASQSINNEQPEALRLYCIPPKGYLYPFTPTPH